MFTSFKYNPGVAEVTLQLPLSKSVANRRMIINYVALGHVDEADENLPDDIRLMNDLLFRIARYRPSDGLLELDCGAAGTVARFITALLAVTEGRFLLKGSPRMQQRPVDPLVDALRELGAAITYTGTMGSIPLYIEGKKLRGGKINLKADVSSQFVSALMMVAPVMTEGLSVKLDGCVVSEPYIAMTHKMMEMAGAIVKRRDNTITIYPGEYKTCCDCQAPDWSATAPWYELVALRTDLKIHFPGLSTDGLQGDEAVSSLFRPLGVETTVTPGGITIFNRGEVMALEPETDLSGCPDLAQCYLATLSALRITQTVTGLLTLKHKETDRLTSMRESLTAMGGYIEIIDNSKAVTGHHRGLQPASLKLYDDHRMAFALIPLTVMCGEVWVDNPGVVAKSYPQYIQHLRMVGFETGERGSDRVL